MAPFRMEQLVEFDDDSGAAMMVVSVPAQGSDGHII